MPRSQGLRRSSRPRLVDDASPLGVGGDGDLAVLRAVELRQRERVGLGVQGRRRLAEVDGVLNLLHQKGMASLKLAFKTEHCRTPWAFGFENELIRIDSREVDEEELPQHRVQSRQSWRKGQSVRYGPYVNEGFVQGYWYESVS